MGSVLGACVDCLHALLMAAWVLGLPLLFWHRWPRLTRAYAIYAIAFVLVNQLSDALLGECVLTTLARASWQHAHRGGWSTASNEWFTVRIAEAVFRLTPSHRGIKVVSEWLILVTAAGVAFHGAASLSAGLHIAPTDRSPRRAAHALRRDEKVASSAPRFPRVPGSGARS